MYMINTEAFEISKCIMLAHFKIYLPITYATLLVEGKISHSKYFLFTKNVFSKNVFSEIITKRLIKPILKYS